MSLHGETIQYSLAVIILGFLTWFAVIKIIYPFWNLQPVLHPYDWMRHIYLACGAQPFIIYRWSHSGRPTTKFYNPFSVKTIRYENATSEDKKYAISLLRRKYIDSPDIVFLCDEIWLDDIVGGGASNGFLSLMKTESSLGLETVKGVCVSYLVSVWLGNGDTLTNAYYLDLLTVDSTAKPTTLFETHEYNQQKGNPAVEITFFKKEVVPYLGITPFIESYSVVFEISQLTIGVILPPTMQIRMVDKSGNGAEFLREFMGRFPVPTISVSFSTLLGWINKQLWFVFFLVRGDELLAIYFFRDTRMQFEQYGEDANTKCIELVGSFTQPTINELIFFTGFQSALKIISGKINLDYRLFQIAKIGKGNTIILRYIEMSNPTQTRTFLAYYFFNYCWKCSGDLLILV